MKKIVIFLAFISLAFTSCKHENEEASPQYSAGEVLKQKTNLQSIPKGDPLIQKKLVELVLLYL